MSYYTRSNGNIPVLFAQRNSTYKAIGCDVYDGKRNALNFSGGVPAIYHPPCRLWSRLRKFSNAPPFEKFYAIWAVHMCRMYGGIVEHPMGSSLWPYMRLPRPGERDRWGFTVSINQYDYGHPARKSTYLYICGHPDQVAALAILNKKLYKAPKKKLGSTAVKGKQATKFERCFTPVFLAKKLVKILHQINK